MREPEDKKRLPFTYNELRKTGFSEIDEINISEQRDHGKLKDYDVYYICGGNTFYILDRIRKTGLDKALGKSIYDNKFYMG